MKSRVARTLLAVSAAILLFGSYLHTSAFKKAHAAVVSSNFPVFYADAFEALWLIDSATMAILAISFALIALRPTLAGRSVIILLGLIPAITSILLYSFIGMFIPAHMLLVASILVFIAAYSL
jgi:hypothetical protein